MEQKLGTFPLEQIKQECHRGIEVNEGWYSLLEEFYNFWIDFKHRADSLKCSDVSYEWFQFKQKFGIVRIYASISYTGSEPSIAKIIEEMKQELSSKIDDIENISASICEICGTDLEVTTNTLPDGFWIYTMCSKCREKECSKRK